SRQLIDRKLSIAGFQGTPIGCPEHSLGEHPRGQFPTIAPDTRDAPAPGTTTGPRQGRRHDDQLRRYLTPGNFEDARFSVARGPSNAIAADPRGEFWAALDPGAAWGGVSGARHTDG